MCKVLFRYTDMQRINKRTEKIKTFSIIITSWEEVTVSSDPSLVDTKRQAEGLLGNHYRKEVLFPKRTKEK